MWGKKQIVLRHGSVRLSLTIAQTTRTTSYMIQAGLLCQLKTCAGRISDGHAIVTTADGLQARGVF